MMFSPNSFYFILSSLKGPYTHYIQKMITIIFMDIFPHYRYEIDGHLTVIRLKDGATTSAHYRSRSKDDRITLNSPLYLGGLPPNYVVSRHFRSSHVLIEVVFLLECTFDILYFKTKYAA